MIRSRSVMLKLWAGVGFEFCALGVSAASWGAGVDLTSAHSAKSPQVIPTERPCGLLVRFGGEVQLLNETRSETLPLSSRTVLGCGVSVLVARGWARIETTPGAVVHLGPSSLASFVRARPEAPDPIVLYRGALYLSLLAGAEALSVVSSGARVRLQHGRGLVVFDPTANITQAITLGGSVEFSNRFVEAARAVLAEGEGSTLDLTLQQITPSAPAVVASGPVQAHLVEMEVPEEDQEEVMRALQRRRQRNFVGELAFKNREAKKTTATRAPASVTSRSDQVNASLSFARRRQATLLGTGEIDQDLLDEDDQSPSQQSGDYLHPTKPLSAEAREAKQRILDQLSRITEPGT